MTVCVGYVPNRSSLISSFRNSHLPQSTFLFLETRGNFVMWETALIMNLSIGHLAKLDRRFVLTCVSKKDDIQDSGASIERISDEVADEQKQDLSRPSLQV